MRPISEIKADAIAWWKSGNSYTCGTVSAPDGREVAELCDEVERLRTDAQRYRFLRRENPQALCSIAWKYPDARIHSQPDQAVDAAVEELCSEPSPTTTQNTTRHNITTHR
jgi:hypothetical protein